MKLKIGLTLAGLVVVVGALAGTKVLQIKTLMAQPHAQPPETVSTSVVRQEKWQGTLSAIGSITAVQGVTVTPEIAGTVTEIAFESGATVAKNDLLVRLDTSSEQAQLRSLEAQEDWARISLERSQKLREQNMVSQSDLDSAEAAMKQAKANADAVQATIEKKTIRAPFAGRLGIRQINLGQYVDAGKPIVSLQALNPVYADFSLPQQDLALLKTGMQVRVGTDAFPDRQFEGALSAINPDLDSTTRSVGLQATLENPGQLLRPGMFARMEVLLPEHQDVLVIPATAILSSPFGDQVFVVEPEKASTNGGLVLRQQFVKAGRSRGDLISIESGLNPGERVVSTGVFKLRNKLSVVENNSIVPPTSAAPKPSDS